MADSFVPSDRPVVLPTDSPSYVKKKERRIRHWEVRCKVTSESMEKKAELAREDIEVRDFAEEGIRREEVEGNCHADEDQALRYERGEDEQGKRARKTPERKLEEDETEAKRLKQD